MAADHDIGAALAQVRHGIAAASRAAGRPASEVSLIAASKMIGLDGLEAALDAGNRIFGENRVPEAAAKWPQLRDRWPGIELHLIGPLQSNKARSAVQHLDVVQSVDRGSLCTALGKEIDRQQRAPRLLVQVNIGDEPQKSGVPVTELAALLATCRAETGIAATGLMCIPPAGHPPEPYFRLLASLADEHGLADRSMGMSGDYAEAVAHGATMVRVGTAIFGRRLSAPGGIAP